MDTIQLLSALSALEAPENDFDNITDHQVDDVKSAPGPTTTTSASSSASSSSGFVAFVMSLMVAKPEDRHIATTTAPTTTTTTTSSATDQPTFFEGGGDDFSGAGASPSSPTSSSIVVGEIIEPDLVALLMRLLHTLEPGQRDRLVNTFLQLCMCPSYGFVNRCLCCSVGVPSALLELPESSLNKPNYFNLLLALLGTSCDVRSLRKIVATSLRTHNLEIAAAYMNLLSRVITQHTSAKPENQQRFIHVRSVNGGGLAAVEPVVYPGGGVTYRFLVRIPSFPAKDVHGHATCPRTLLCFVVGERATPLSQQWLSFAIKVAPVSPTSTNFHMLFCSRKEARAPVGTATSSLELPFDTWHTIDIIHTYHLLSASSIAVAVEGGKPQHKIGLKYPPTVPGTYYFGCCPPAPDDVPLAFELRAAIAIRDASDAFEWNETSYAKLLFSYTAARFQGGQLFDLSADAKVPRGALLNGVVRASSAVSYSPCTFVQSAASVGDSSVWLLLLDHTCLEGGIETVPIALRVVLSVLLKRPSCVQWLVEHSGFLHIVHCLKSLPSEGVPVEVARVLLSIYSQQLTEPQLVRAFRRDVLVNYRLWNRSDTTVQTLILSAIVDDLSVEDKSQLYAADTDWCTFMDAVVESWTFGEVTATVLSMQTHILGILAEAQNASREYFQRLLDVLHTRQLRTYIMQHVVGIMTFLVKSHASLREGADIAELLISLTKFTDVIIVQHVIHAAVSLPSFHFSAIAPVLVKLRYDRRLVDIVAANIATAPELARLLLMYLRPDVSKPNERIHVLQSVVTALTRTPTATDKLMKDLGTPLWTAYVSSAIPACGSGEESTDVRSDLTELVARVYALFLSRHVVSMGPGCLSVVLVALRQCFVVITDKQHRGHILQCVVDALGSSPFPTSSGKVPMESFAELCDHLLENDVEEKLVVDCMRLIGHCVQYPTDESESAIVTVLALRQLGFTAHRVTTLNTKLDAITSLTVTAQTSFEQIRAYIATKATETATALSAAEESLRCQVTDFLRRVATVVDLEPELSGHYCTFFLSELMALHRRTPIPMRDFDHIVNQFFTSHYHKLKRLHFAFNNMTTDSGDDSSGLDNSEVESVMLLSALLDDSLSEEWRATFTHGSDVVRAARRSHREDDAVVSLVDLHTMRVDHEEAYLIDGQKMMEIRTSEAEALATAEATRSMVAQEERERTLQLMRGRHKKLCNSGMDTFVGEWWAKERYMWRVDHVGAFTNAGALRYRLRRTKKGITPEATAASRNNPPPSNNVVPNTSGLGGAVESITMTSTLSRFVAKTSNQDLEALDRAVDDGAADGEDISPGGAVVESDAVDEVESVGERFESPSPSPAARCPSVDATGEAAHVTTTTVIDVDADEQTLQDNYSFEVLANSAKELLQVTAEVIRVHSNYSGTLHIHKDFVYFIHTLGEGDVGCRRRDLCISRSTIKAVVERRHCLRHNSLEIAVDSATKTTTVFFRFDSSETMGSVLRLLQTNTGTSASSVVGSTLAPLLRGLSTKRAAPSQFSKCRATTDWVNRRITTFSYLMHLNHLASRTMNDTNQYPVFPWVLADYTSPKLDLSSTATFRDLSKPIGAQDSAQAERFVTRYHELDGTDIPKFHYGTHYSNSGGVLYYLVRLKPFSDMLWKLQGGSWDVPDRMFHSILESYHNVTHSSADVKELVPEFFFMPEMLMNVNKFDFGMRADGQKLDNVVLPIWASNAYDFVAQHREALESEYVSQNLHNWIDLIFGHKQRGAAAEEAVNTYYFLTYEGAVDWDAVADETERTALEQQVLCYGQCPMQLGTRPHPRRLGPRQYSTLLAHAPASPEQLKLHLESNTAVPGGQCVRQMAIADGVMYVMHSPWNIAMYRTSHTSTNLEAVGTRVLAPGGLPPSTSFGWDNAFFVYAAHKALYSASWYDNTALKMHRTTSGRTVCTVPSTGSSTSMVRAVAVSECGDFVVTGSDDALVRTYAVLPNLRDVELTHTFYGHSHAVTSVLVHSSLDVVASGGDDTFVLIFALRKGCLVRRVDTSVPCVRLLGLLTIPMPVFTVVLSNATVATYTLNGAELWQRRFDGTITTAKLCAATQVTPNILVVGEARRVHVFNVSGGKPILTRVSTVPQEATSCLLVPEHLQLWVGSSDGMIFGFRMQ